MDNEQIAGLSPELPQVRTPLADLLGETVAILT
jgi:hypothetical protein